MYTHVSRNCDCKYSVKMYFPEEKQFLWADTTGTGETFIDCLNALRVAKDASDSCLYINMALVCDLRKA